jgi:hypothetical protein
MLTSFTRTASRTLVQKSFSYNQPSARFLTNVTVKQSVNVNCSKSPALATQSASGRGGRYVGPGSNDLIVEELKRLLRNTNQRKNYHKKKMNPGRVRLESEIAGGLGGALGVL